MTHHLLWFNTMLGQLWWPTIHYDSIQCQDSCDDPPFTVIKSNVRTVVMTHHLLGFNTMLGQLWWPTTYYDSIQCQDSCDDPPFIMIQYNVRTVVMTHHLLWFNTMSGRLWWPTIYYDSKKCQDSCDDPPFTLIQRNVRTVAMTHQHRSASWPGRESHQPIRLWTGQTLRTALPVTQLWGSAGSPEQWKMRKASTQSTKKGGN